mmetsp:Transcript_55317/g.120990  ORF Transcript_55317/g.120990 Transcript_55317/m.120990 type:complete len:132 (+) Transcript_55317:28-423(+)
MTHRGLVDVQASKTARTCHGRRHRQPPKGGLQKASRQKAGSCGDATACVGRDEEEEEGKKKNKSVTRVCPLNRAGRRERTESEQRGERFGGAKGSFGLSDGVGETARSTTTWTTWLEGAGALGLSTLVLSK